MPQTIRVLGRLLLRLVGSGILAVIIAGTSLLIGGLTLPEEMPRDFKAYMQTIEFSIFIVLVSQLGLTLLLAFAFLLGKLRSLGDEVLILLIALALTYFFKRSIGIYSYLELVLFLIALLSVWRILSLRHQPQGDTR